MIIQASNGCFLTQSEDVSVEKRRFEKSMLVSSIEEASKWKEIPESEKDKIIAEEELFQPEKVDYGYLNKVESLISVIADKINDGGLTAEQSLEMQKYYPNWEDELGKEVYAGYRFNYQETLLEVVTPHTLSEDINPAQQPMTLNELSDETQEQQNKYYKLVKSEVIESEDPLEEESVETKEEDTENILQSSEK